MFFKEGFELIRAAHVPCFPLCGFTSLQFTAKARRQIRCNGPAKVVGSSPDLLLSVGAIQP